MNERIKELAEKAGLRFTQLMSNPMVPVVDGKETDLEKFAELLIRECASRVDNILREKKDGGGTIGDEIREHFGVEL